MTSSKNKEFFTNKQGQLVPALPPKRFADQKMNGIVIDEKKLMQIAFCFRMNAEPLRKFLENRSPSKYILKKVEKVQADLCKESALVDLLLKSSRGQKLVSIFRLYQKEGSLEKVGKIMGLSRERIRQLLNKGSKLGLFEYKKLNLQTLPQLSREKIVEDYKKTLRLKEVAKINCISLRQLSKSLQILNIYRSELNAIRFEGRRINCVNQYLLLVREIGGHPSTSEMEETSEGLSLFNKIIRLWGSIKDFREELNIEIATRRTPSYRT